MSFLENLPKPFFVLAPMDDVTDTVFRQIVAGCAKPDLSFTEFVNVDGLQSPGRERLLHKLKLSDPEKPVIAQLWGLNPENYYKTVKEIVDGSLVAEANGLRARNLHSSKVQGSEGARTRRTDGTLSESRTQLTQQFSGVDINMGCPVKTVIKNGACAALINNRELAGEIIGAVQRAAGEHFPVSVKTRVGFNNKDLTWIEFLLMKKLNMLSIHGRTAKQMSKSPVDWEAIGQIVEMRNSLSPETKIIGNGDVMSKIAAHELANKYNLDGVMIGRGIFHDPFIFADESPWETWSADQKLSLFKKHIELYMAIYTEEERRFETLRKFCKVYINGFDGASDLRTKFMNSTSAEQALELL